MLWMGIWVHPYAVIGGGFLENWGMAEPERWCNVMVEAPNGSTLTLLRLCRWGWILRKFMCRARPEWCCNVMVEAPKPRRLHPKYISYIQKVLALWLAVDGHMGPPLRCYACAGGGGFLENLCRAGPKRCWKFMVEAPNPCRLHPTYISYVDEVF